MSEAGAQALWQGVDLEALVQDFGSPLFVYHGEKIKVQYQALAEALTWPDCHIYYAVKANSNLNVLKILYEAGACLEAVSPGELALCQQVTQDPQRLCFTGHNCSEADFKEVLKSGVPIILDSLSQAKRLAKLAPGHEVALRLNPHIGAGHHEHVITAGPQAKFGEDASQLPELMKAIKDMGLVLVGLHQHIGSGITHLEDFRLAAHALVEMMCPHETLRFVDLGGGFGIPYQNEDQPLDLKQADQVLNEAMTAMSDKVGRSLSLHLEPGRFLVAEAGLLLTTVESVKQGRELLFVGTDSGFNHLIRHMVYRAYHGILNLSRPEAEPVMQTIAGNICESGDLFSHGRVIPRCQEGDILALCDAGAYAFSMASRYNSRPLPAEVLWWQHKPHLIRKRESYPQMWEQQELVL